MAPGTLFGVVLIGAGILGLAVSRVLTDLAANSHAYLRPRLDKAAFKRRNLRIVRIMAGAWVLLGAGIAIFAAVKGN